MVSISVTVPAESIGQFGFQVMDLNQNSGFGRTLLYNEAKTLALYESVYQHYHATIFTKNDLRVGAMF